MSTAQVATGEGIWKYLNDFGPLFPGWYIYYGQHKWIQPMTPKGQILFISGCAGVGGIYWQKHAIWHTRDLSTLIRNGFVLQTALEAGAKVKWVLPVYKALIAFGLQVVPGAKWVGRAVSLLSLAKFWSYHSEEIEKCTQTATALFKDMRWFHNKCEKLSMLLLTMALEKSHDQVMVEAREKGLVHVITSQLDFEKYMEDIATFVGALLKLVICGSGTSPLGWLGKRGLARLSMVVEMMWKVHKITSVAQKGMAVASGPGLKDPQLLLTKFLNVLSNPDMTSMQARIQAADTEGHLKNPMVLQKLESMKKHSDELDRLATKLTEAAEWELF